MLEWTISIYLADCVAVRADLLFWWTRGSGIAMRALGL